MLPVSGELRLESLLQNRNPSQAGLWGPQGAPHLPLSRCLRPTSGTGIWSPAGRRVPDTSPFTLFPLSSSLCLQATEALVTGEKLASGLSLLVTSGLPGSPLLPPLASESRASGRLQPCQTRPQPPSSRDQPGRPVGPRGLHTRDSPELCQMRQVCVLDRISSTQYKPEVTACKSELCTIINHSVAMISAPIFSRRAAS